jgi:hypothetical protein
VGALEGAKVGWAMGRAVEGCGVGFRVGALVSAIVHERFALPSVKLSPDAANMTVYAL